VLLAGALRFGEASLPAAYTLALGVGLGLWVPVFHFYGLYATRHLSASEEFRRIIGASSIGVLLIVLTSYWSHTTLARQWVAMTWVLVLVLELVSRRVWRRAVWKLRNDGRLSLRTLIVGTNHEAGSLGETFKDPSLGFEPLGYVATTGSALSPDGLETKGELSRLTSLIREHAADCVFVASTAISPQDMMKVVSSARQAGAEVRVSANLPQLLATRLSVQPMGRDVMSISLKPVRLSGTETVMKRAFDLVAASAGLLVALPVMLVLAAAIKLTSPGPVLFRQQRITKGGRAFTVYKFRTMLVDGDPLLEDRAADKSAAFFKIENDPRLTRVGRFIRRTSLDELPQLINVVKGDMSLVGPRPLPVDQVAANLELLGPRHEVPAGVTGWWQVNGRSDVSPQEAVRLDLFYIENWSLSLDLYILLKTASCLLARRGAY
jgi:exopolysaccharide biosynthesis polyprenyl glycosylphosphotransferase